MMLGGSHSIEQRLVPEEGGSAYSNAKHHSGPALELG
jgi:hypothetical protein